MKTVYFIRHAKSSNDAKKDIDRKINQRGEKDINFMATFLKDKGVMPDIIISSNATRAMQTSQIILDTLNFKDKISVQKNLYEANLKDFLKVFHDIKAKFNTIFIVAHNPAITEICEYLSNSVIDHMPTSSIFCIEFDAQTFKDIKEHSGKVVFFNYPKLHKNK